MNFPGKKIIYITHSYNNFIKNQIELISPHFEQVSVLVRTKPVAELSNYLPIPYFEPFNLKSLINTETLPDNVEVIPIPLYYLPFDSSYKKLGLDHYRAVEQVIRKRGVTFDLIHAHFTWTAGYVGMRLKEMSEKPFIITAHGYDIYDLPFRDDVWRTNISSVLESADHIITVSGKNQECIRRLNVSTAVSVIPNGFKTDPFYPRDMQECRKKLGLPPDRKILLNVGALVDVKAQADLIEAVDRLKESHPDLLCIIVGSGKLKNRLSRLIIKKGLQDHVTLAGGKPHAEIPLWINACDAFVLSSHAEGNPTVMFECLGCGKPFIGTKVGGIPEIISSEDQGFIVEPGDVTGLSRSMAAAFSKEWDRKVILDYAQQFTWERLTHAITDIYGALLKREYPSEKKRALPDP